MTSSNSTSSLNYSSLLHSSSSDHSPVASTSVYSLNSTSNSCIPTTVLESAPEQQGHHVVVPHTSVVSIAEKWKKMNNAEKVQFVEGCKCEDISFSDNKRDISSIKGVPIALFSVNLLRKFTSVNHITVGVERNRVALLTNITQHALGINQGIKLMIRAKGRRKSQKSRPTNVEKDGTYFRIVNVILDPRCRDAYRKTGDELTRDQLDSRQGHRASYRMMYELYIDEDEEELSTIGDKTFEHVYRSHGYNNEYISDFDRLSFDDFMSTVQYINNKYDEARKKRDRSGSHDDFPNYIEGKMWLLYYWARMNELGDEAYFQLASPDLGDDVFIVSEGKKSKNERTDTTPKAKMNLLDRKRIEQATSANARNIEICESLRRNKRDTAYKLIDVTVAELQILEDELDNVDDDIDHIVESGCSDEKKLRKLKRKRENIEDRIALKKEYGAKLMADLDK